MSILQFENHGPGHIGDVLQRMHEADNQERDVDLPGE
jgi:hypothetical protein